MQEVLKNMVFECSRNGMLGSFEWGEAIYFGEVMLPRGNLHLLLKAMLRVSSVIRTPLPPPRRLFAKQGPSPYPDVETPTHRADIPPQEVSCFRKVFLFF